MAVTINPDFQNLNGYLFQIALPSPLKRVLILKEDRKGRKSSIFTEYMDDVSIAAVAAKEAISKRLGEFLDLGDGYYWAEDSPVEALVEILEFWDDEYADLLEDSLDSYEAGKKEFRKAAKELAQGTYQERFPTKHDVKQALSLLVVSISPVTGKTEGVIAESMQKAAAQSLSQKLRDRVYLALMQVPEYMGAATKTRFKQNAANFLKEELKIANMLLTKFGITGAVAADLDLVKTLLSLSLQRLEGGSGDDRVLKDFDQLRGDGTIEHFRNLLKHMGDRRLAAFDEAKDLLFPSIKTILKEKLAKAVKEERYSDAYDIGAELKALTEEESKSDPDPVEADEAKDDATEADEAEAEVVDDDDEADEVDEEDEEIEEDEDEDEDEDDF